VHSNKKSNKHFLNI